jgi:hypothetical protein
MIRFIAVVPIAVLLAACGQKSKEVKTDGYQAVLLDSGQVYFGKLEGLGSDYPVLTNVFYVQSVTNSETKQTTNVLVKRGKEWHAPDRMTINAHHIVFVEPVTPGSQVANLISQAK